MFNNIYTFFSPHSQKLYRHATRQGLGIIISLGLFFLGIAILVIIFPYVLAFFVASLFVLASLFCLSLAWKIYRLHRQATNNQVQVTILDPDE